MPRRSVPRTRVPARAVALAGEFSGVYPRESPGGWQLIGHTTAAALGPRPRPARAAGARRPGPVRGGVDDRPVGAVARGGHPRRAHHRAGPGPARPGCPRASATPVPRTRPALRLANRLLGNPESAAALEVTFGGLEVVAHGGVTVIADRRPLPGDGRRAARGAPTASSGCPTARRSAWARRAAGLRSYLAVRGRDRGARRGWAPGPRTPWPRWARRRSRPGDRLPVGAARGRAAGRRRRTGAGCRRRATSPCGSSTDRAPTGSPRPRTRPWCRTPTRSPRTATASACGCPGRALERVAGPRAVQRGHGLRRPPGAARPASRPSSSPTTPSPAATPSSRWSCPPTSRARRRSGPASASPSPAVLDHPADPRSTR